MRLLCEYVLQTRFRVLACVKVFIRTAFLMQYMKINIAAETRSSHGLNLTLQYRWIAEILTLQSHIPILKSSCLKRFQLVSVLCNQSGERGGSCRRGLVVTKGVATAASYRRKKEEDQEEEINLNL